MKNESATRACLDGDGGGFNALLARVNNADGVRADFFGGANGMLAPASDWGAVTWAAGGAAAGVAADVGGVKMPARGRTLSLAWHPGMLSDSNKSTPRHNPHDQPETRGLF